ncbi:transporter substrate-binding domain-containing protein [Zoogloea sp.]|uniref:substrate-binding periplasmic protein n=1 Tax=Zoogloea sp. TaxID=49181 RepID=UPI0031FBE64F
MLHFYTTEVPPFAFTDRAGRITGYCIEVVHALLRRTGDRGEIVSLPWARAYQTALSEPSTVLICPKRTEEREKLFQWVGPLFSTSTEFFARTQDSLRINSLEEARGVSSVLIQRNYYSVPDLQRAGFQNLYLTTSPLTSVRMLLGGRAPLMVMDRLMLPDLLRQEGVSADAIESVFTLSPDTGYLTFSRDVPAAVLKRWQSALNDMQRTGTLNQLKRRWLSGELPR